MNSILDYTKIFQFFAMCFILLMGSFGLIIVNDFVQRAVARIRKGK